ncbi:MAG: hypothetical protein V2J51_05295 [Erythrobacter sp.]|jgi:hypothetical protein|nr:hypothetical protein [Erythrobacter sp.]
MFLSFLIAALFAAVTIIAGAILLDSAIKAHGAWCSLARERALYCGVTGAALPVQSVRAARPKAAAFVSRRKSGGRTALSLAA